MQRTIPLIAGLGAAVFCSAASPALAQKDLWTRQFGAQASETILAAAPDGAGGVFSAGFVHHGPAGDDNALLAHHDSAGALSWSVQFGTAGEDQALAATPDGAGGVFIGGVTTGSLGGTHAGFDDVWLARYDGAGTQLWIRQLGSGLFEQLHAAAPDGAGGVYVGGFTTGDLVVPSGPQRDAWLARYDGSGTQLWILQFKLAAPGGHDNLDLAAPDGAGGVYAGGHTNEPFQDDAWLGRFDAAGNTLWIRRFGSVLQDHATAGTPDGVGGVYVAGRTTGNLGASNAGNWDAWLARYDAAGNQVWMRQFGSGLWDEVGGAALASDGVYLTGRTRGSVAGPNLGGPWDAWLAHYDAAGNPVWVRQVGTSDEDHGYAAAEDGAGGFYAGGTTRGVLGASNAGAADAWLARYETSSVIYCTARVNSCGGTPTLLRNGIASAAASSGFTIAAGGARQNKTGILLYSGSGGANAPFFGGTLCVDPGMGRRTVPAVSTGGTPGACDATFAIDMNAFAAGALGGNQPAWLSTPGQQINAQWWGRDNPAHGVYLSDAVEYSVCP